MSLLAADGLRILRGGRAILDNVSFAAGAGEFVAVIGPNGAGKSTLLSALAGLMTPDSGRVALDDKPLSTFTPQELARRRAYLPQNPVCEWPITVERLVALGLTAHLPTFGGLPPSFDAAISRALEACDLAQRRDQPVTTLSGGELSRAMLARALVGEPQILIVDEPVTGLDPAHAMDCARRLSLYAQSGKLVIASLHDLTLAARHADRILALKDGSVAGEGSTQDILTPALIRDVFAVDGQLRGTGSHASVELHSLG